MVPPGLAATVSVSLDRRYSLPCTAAAVLVQCKPHDETHPPTPQEPLMSRPASPGVDVFVLREIEKLENRMRLTRTSSFA